MQRTERQLIDAALAVNEARTLGESLDALAASAQALVAADDVWILVWDDDLRCATTETSSATTPATGERVPSSELTAALIARGDAFVIREAHVEGLSDELRDSALGVGTLLCVPLNQEGLPTITFSAAWNEPVNAEVTELAISKLRLLGRLTGVAFRTEAVRVRGREDARLRAVLEAVPDGLVVRTDAGSTANTAAREILCTGENEPRVLSLRELDGTELLEEDTPLELAKSTGEAQSYTLRVTRCDGVERIHEGRIAPVVDDTGSVFATVTSFRDITEAHEEQFVTQQFLDRLFESLPTAIAVCDPETSEVRRVNAAFVELLGFDAKEAVGTIPPYPWLTGGLLPSEAEPKTYERLFRRKTGELIPADVTKTVICDAEGVPAATVVLIADKSERRNFEQRLIQSGKLASIGELAAGVAHEINNPLFAILGLVEFLLMEVEPGTKARDRLEMIQGTALEIKEIVRALLDFARERSDELSLISLNDVAAQTVELMRRTSSAKQVEIVERIGDADVRIEASANQLKQIFVNLISNAKQALKDSGGTITVEVGREGDCAWAEVRDDGPGIPEDLRARIFEPFFTTRRDSGGTGLGLSVSLGIAESHGGSLVVDGNAGGGASFRLQIPIAVKGAA
ncbi:MAG: two-component system, NtrC family, sensor kinase [Gaiellaceae bacterium]|jgi:PAS domain S-box-containing protein|nr:two-component system, NtrC family, sensor kinase [Gaiellaceae bacterium]